MEQRTPGSRLYWVTNHYTYYHDYLFQHIHADGRFELVVYYRKLVLESHPWKSLSTGEYTTIVLAKNLMGLDLRLILTAIFKKHHFVIAGWDNFLYVILITILRLRKVSFGVFSDTPRKPGVTFIQVMKKRWLQFVFSPSGKGRLFVTGEVGVRRSIEYFALDRNRVINFPFTTNHTVFCPMPDSIPDKRGGPVILLAVGRIDFNHKGQDVALQALSDLIKRGKSNFRYRIAGTGDDLPEMQKMIVALGLDGYVEHLGWVEIQDLPRLFNEAHFTLHTSHEDPFPNSILESLSCGVPVISSDAAGSSLERIQPGINGFLYPDGDHAALMSILEQALGMPESEWKKMKSRSREMALEWPISYNLSMMNQLFSGTNPE